MVENCRTENGGKAPPENGGMENDRPRKWRKFIGLENGGKCLTGKWWNGKRQPWKKVEKCRTGKLWKMHDRKMKQWKMIALENDGMENDIPGKWWNITGLENDCPGK